MQLVLSNGLRFQLMPQCEEAHDSGTNETHYAPIPGLWAIPGGACRTTSQVQRWAAENGAVLL